MTLTCPKCQADMRTYERNGVHVDQCTECRGIFLDRGELEKLVDAENSWHGEDSAPAAGRPGDADVRRDAAPTAGPADTSPGSAAAAGAAGGGLGAIVGEVLQQVKAAKSSGSSDRGYDRGYDRGDDRGHGGYDRGHGGGYDPRYGKQRKKKSFLDELFG